MDGFNRADLAEIAETIRELDSIQLGEFADFLRHVTADGSEPYGRPLGSVMVISAVEWAREGKDPGHVLDVWDAAVRLSDSPAASRVPIDDRIAALPSTWKEPVP